MIVFLFLRVIKTKIMNALEKLKVYSDLVRFVASLLSKQEKKLLLLNEKQPQGKIVFLGREEDY